MPILSSVYFMRYLYFNISSLWFTVLVGLCFWLIYDVVPVSFCPPSITCVCLSVRFFCSQNNSKTYGRTFRIFSRFVGTDTWTSWLNFLEKNPEKNAGFRSRIKSGIKRAHKIMDGFRRHFQRFSELVQGQTD